MSRAVFIDANVPVYAAGRPHPNKTPCVRIMAMVVEQPLAFFTDVEVLQELVHLYTASRRWALGREVLRDFTEVMHGRIEPVYVEDVNLAARLVDEHPGVSARDLVHAAVMRWVGADRIVSADGFRPSAGCGAVKPCRCRGVEQPCLNWHMGDLGHDVIRDAKHDRGAGW